jgi:hypothetical protein
MAGIAVNEGRSKTLTDSVKDAQTTLYLRLYTNASQPTKTQSLPVTEVSTLLSGYAAIPLTDTDWTEVSQVITNIEKTFTAGEDWGNVTGYYISTTSNDTGLLLYVESFSLPLNMTNGSILKITPKISNVDPA